MAWEVLSACIQGATAIIAAKIVVTGGLKGLENWKNESSGRRRFELAEECIILSEDIPQKIWSLRAYEHLVHYSHRMGTTPYELKDLVSADDAFARSVKQVEEVVEKFSQRSKILSIYAGQKARVASISYRQAVRQIGREHTEARDIITNKEADLETRKSAWEKFMGRYKDYGDERKAYQEILRIHEDFENLFVSEMRSGQQQGRLK